MKKNNFSLQRGFSLVEMMIAASVLGVLIVAGMNYFTQMQSSNNYLEFQIKKEQLRAVVLNQFLTNENNCKCAFQGAADFPEAGIERLNAPSPTSLGRYKFVTEGDCSTANLGLTFVNEQGMDGLKLKGAKIQKIQNFSGNYAGEFVFAITSMKKVTGPSTSLLKIPVNIKTSPGAGTNKKFEGCSMAGTFSVQLQQLLSKVIDVSHTSCLRDTGSNTTHTIEKKCDAGTKLLGCSGGPGDIHDMHEGWWIIPDFKTDTCKLSIVKPACVSSEPWTYQKVIALCYPE